MSFTSDAHQELATALARLSGRPPETFLALFEKPKKREFGDIALPCFQFAKEMRKAPQACAQELAQAIELPQQIESVEAQGPFLNFKLKRAEAAAAAAAEHSSPRHSVAHALDVIVEFSSPNIAKPFHVGHLRATLIGNCLDRVYRYLGHHAVSINHLGDWGTQFGFVWAGCELWGKPAQESVTGLLEIYRRATSLKASQDERGIAADERDINAMAREYFKDLESGESYAREFWKWCSDISLAYFKETYARLNVRFDHYTGESFYSSMLSDVHDWLDNGGILEESEKAYGVDLGDLGFARIATPDGRSLYLTRDIATARYRAQTFHFDRAVYVVGATQTLHFQQLVEILRRMGEPYADTIVHVPFGLVLGIKTRGEGQFFELNAFLDEAFERALIAYHQQVTKRPEGLDDQAVARAVGLSAIVFGNLSRTNTKDVHFDWDSALTLQGDSGPYILYAYARISGIKERAALAGILPENGSTNVEAFRSDSAFFLAEQLEDFEAVLYRTLELHEPSQLAGYALELAKLVSRCYLDLKVVGEDSQVAASRLALFCRAQVVLGECIDLLGMDRLERM